MSTELERRDDQLARQIDRVAARVAATNLYPALRGKPDEAALYLWEAAALGLQPSPGVIGKFYSPQPGHIEKMAALQVALAHRYGHEVWADDANDATKAVVYFRRNGSERVQRIEYTMEDAKRANLTGKDVWKKFPADMLHARAMTKAVRQVAPGVTLGFEQEAIAEAAGEVEVIDRPGPPQPVGREDVVDAEIVEEPLGESGEDNAWLARFGQALEAVTPPGYTAREVEHAVICHATECETGDASKVHVDQHDAVKKAYVGLREGFLELQRTDNGTFLVEAEPPDAAA